ncbi:hypothetical protein BKA70DRAFT_1027155, partial [Coprinopsis sp. MPI-PUGE-AT-0042]
KYLGVLVDGELKWHAQTMRVVDNTTKWVMLFHRLTKPTTGVGLRLMRQLYMSVGVPKLTYALDVWYTPPHKEAGKKRNGGSVKATKLMTKVQRITTIAITGALKSTSTDALDTHAGIPPT